jgi:hypothetical protein
MAAVPVNPGVIHTEMLETCFGAEAAFVPLARSMGSTRRPVPAGPGPANTTANRRPCSKAAALLAGRLTRLDSGVECLEVDVQIEPFDNGAHVRLTVTQRSDMPDEIQLTIHAQPDSAPMTYCILTATMGNKARARRLWLKDRAVSSLDLYPDYREAAFTPHRFFPLNQLYRNPAGDILAAITTDEEEPSAVEPFPRRTHWYYGGFPVTQYWKKPAGLWREDLHVAVNGRYTYWMSQQPIPGGISFENFEFRERFYEGQRFHFGITSDPGLSRPRIMTP